MFVIKRRDTYLLDSGFFGFPNIIDAVVGFDDKDEAEATAWGMGHEALIIEVSPYQLRVINEAA